MQRTGGVRSRAARLLGIASSTLYEKLKKYGLDS
jgi:DNA-binding protein Fis